jgi:hypothetical protein
MPIRKPPEWIGLFEAVERIMSEFDLGYSASIEIVQNAVLSKMTPVRGIASGDVTHRIISDLLRPSMHVDISVRSSEIREYRTVLWRDVEASGKEFLLYVEENQIPNWVRQSRPSARGRKTEKKTRRPEILAEFDKQTLCGKRGELTAIAKQLNKKFLDYKVDTIRKMIQPTYRQKVHKSPKAS